jgi:hypothetical protein
LTSTPPDVPNRYALPHTPALVLIDFLIQFELDGNELTTDDLHAVAAALLSGASR